MKLNKIVKSLSLIFLSATLLSYTYFCPSKCFAKQSSIYIAGSTTVFPFISLAAEEFSRLTGSPSPIIESMGTGSGIDIFCKGNDAKYPSIAMASRKMTKGEIERCLEQGVKNITEVLLGQDGLVLISAKTSPYDLDLSFNDLFYAISKYSIRDNELVTNNSSSWKEINPSFDDFKIEIYGPRETSGSFDTISELLYKNFCMAKSAFESAFPNRTERMQECAKIREDGHYISVGNNENVIIQKTKKSDITVGIIGFGYFLESKDKIKAHKFLGIEPSYATISEEIYPLTRSLYLYIKIDQLKSNEELRSFLDQLVTKKAIGKNGHMAKVGLIWPQDEKITEARKILAFKPE